MFSNLTTKHSFEQAYQQFLSQFPEFQAVSSVDELRAAEYSRLDTLRQTYLDYTGGGLYAEKQLNEHMQLLKNNVFGNPHSENPTSRAMTELVEQARKDVLRFFRADPNEYTAIFTPNASGALKLVGESYPFSAGGHFALTYDNHNSVNGIREYARAKGAGITYIPVIAPDLRLDESELQTIINTPANGAARLLAYPAQSNFSGVQHNTEWIEYAQRQGWDVLLDAAAFAPTNRLDLSAIHPDFVPLSFYKLFGYPTGVGCLLARKTALRRMRRPWFAGGAIWAVSVESENVYMADDEAAFEDGTVNFLNLPAVSIGLNHMESVGVETIHTRVMCLSQWLLEQLQLIRHSNGEPMAEIYGPKDVYRRGATIALNFLTPEGHVIDERIVDRTASQENISVRTGCFCNPGAGEQAFRLSREKIVNIFQNADRPEYDTFLSAMGLQSGGAVRVSLGIASNFADVFRFWEYAHTFHDNTPNSQDLPARRHC